jgi:hypothetical protein
VFVLDQGDEGFNPDGLERFIVPNRSGIPNSFFFFRK